MKRKLFSIITILFFTLGMTATAFGQTEGYSRALYSPGNSTNQSLRGLQNDFRKVAQAALPVVVSLDVVDVVEQQVRNPKSPFDFFFGNPNNRNNQEKEPETREFRQQGLGSGVIVQKTGRTVYVLTNHHVAGTADEITINLYDGRSFSGTLVGSDSRKDLALVKFETAENIPVAKLGDSDQSQVGDIVFAVGNPLGFESTFTYGIISAVGRTGGPGVEGNLTDYIQTDAAINRGNSGGALVNIDGDVIGINTWIASQTGGNIGIGFSIPINNAKKTIQDLIESGEVQYGWLGISMGDPSENIARDMGFNGQKGSFVFNVYKDSPAMKGGIRPGDLITSIDGKRVNSSDKLLQEVAALEPGRTYSFGLIRDGSAQTVRVRIATRAPEDAIRSNVANLWPGMTVVGITDEIRDRLDLPRNMGNVMVGAVEQGSPAYNAGFRSGDIIKEINRTRIESSRDFYRVFNAEESDELIFKVNRQGNDMILGLVR
ncbi:Do family serine endopeptidase [Marispirochaeta sp.]|uniref:Do family serine endopeptidase n=1 Tax=Marispirochaeta sp. TaxID=2038653 RepID=UPI0029C72605|nr:Do family serine endopeptidase [Marispirochaeta sp.]